MILARGHATPALHQILRRLDFFVPGEVLHPASAVKSASTGQREMAT